MQKLFFVGVLLALSVPGVVLARRAAPPPMPMRIAVGDLVLVGKVTNLGTKTVPAEVFQGDSRNLQTATIEVSDTLFGMAVKKLTVGYMAPSGRMPGVTLQQDSSVLLILVKHPKKKDFYLVRNYYDAVMTNENATELADAKKYAKLLADPKKGLQSKDAEQRYVTAAMLVTRYRTAPEGVASPKTASVAADQSKQILTILAETNWNPKDPTLARMSPRSIFPLLGLTAGDGWTPPTDFNQFASTAQKWLKDNSGKYRIQRYVGLIEKPEEPSR